MTNTKRTTMLYYKTRDEVLVSVIMRLLRESAPTHCDAQVKYDQLIALHEARKALRQRRKSR